LQQQTAGSPLTSILTSVRLSKEWEDTSDGRVVHVVNIEKCNQFMKNTLLDNEIQQSCSYFARRPTYEISRLSWLSNEKKIK